MKAGEGVTVLWPSGRLRECDWIKYLLSELPARHEKADRLPDKARSRTIYVVSSNKLPLAQVSADFLRSAAATRGVGLLHLSDEWFGQDCTPYKNFSFVMRTHYTHALVHPGILILPLGWPNGTPHRRCPGPASGRRYLWSYCGTRMASRPDMLAAFRALEPSYVVPAGARIPHDDFTELLRESTFVPCPMGNVMLETWRVYEALQAGAIPIVERRVFMDYFRELFGESPLPAFSSWRAARKWVASMAGQPESIDRLQKQLGKWWNDELARLRTRACTFVSRGLNGEFRGPLREFQFHHGVMRKAWQYTELTRHHSTAALLRRLSLIASRRFGPASRTGRS